MGWFGNLVDGGLHLLGDAVHGGEHLLGDVAEGGSHLVAGGLNLVGLHSAAQSVTQFGGNLASDLGVTPPEEQLGQTTDPQLLVHGDPAAITKSAQLLARFAGSFGETAAGLRGISPGTWTGSAADGFHARFAPQPGQWQTASSASKQASGALDSYAATVRSAQSQAAHAVSLWEEGQRATQAAVTSYNNQVSTYNNAARAYDAALSAGRAPGPRPASPGPFTDPGEALREQAQQVLAAARTSRNEAAATAAGTIKTATGTAPPEPPAWQQLLDDGSDLFQAGQQAGVSLASGAIGGIAGIVSTAREADPFDPWNLTHLPQYATTLAGMDSALAGDALHPEDLVKSVIGTGWSTDPAQAAGRLLPQVLLAAGTDGAGAAADAGADGAIAAADGAAGAAADGGTAAADGGAGAGGADSAAQGPGDMTQAGEPVDVATGDVIMTAADVTLPGALPLVFERAHRSGLRPGRWLGPSWASTLDQRAEASAAGIAVAFADGRVLCYPAPGATGEPAYPVAGPRWPLTGEPDGGYAVRNPQAGLTWRFALPAGAAATGGPPDPGGDGYSDLPLASVTDRAGRQVTFGYEPDGTPAWIRHHGGYQVNVETTAGRVTGLYLAAAGHGGGDLALVRYGYDSGGQLAEVYNSSGQPLRLSYDRAGRLAGWQDRNGAGYGYGYDERGRCVRGDGPDGTWSGTFRYAPRPGGADGMITAYTDSAGAVTRYEVDGRRQVTAVTDPLGAVTRYARDGRGQVTAVTDPLGRITVYARDEAQNLIAVTRPDGRQSTAAYDDRCLPLSVTAFDGAQTRYDWDERGSLAAVTGPDCAVTRYGRDEHGHLSAVTGPDGAVTRVSCNPAGLPAAVAGPAGQTTRWERDRLGRVTAITGPDGAVTRLQWTLEGRLAARTGADGAAERAEYDGEGNLIARRGAAGGVTRWEYGVFDQPAAVTGPDGIRAAFGYDTELRLTSVTRAGLTWRYDYDAAGRLAAETDANGAVTRYARDPLGQVTSRVNAAGQRTGYSYDELANQIGRPHV